MKRQPLIWEIFFTVVLIAVLHQIALTFFLYYTVPWFDILMHFLGGFWIALSIIFIFYTSGHIKLPKEHRNLVFFFVISGALVIGLGWELWELFIGFSNVLEHKLDTIVDIIMDTIGAVFAFIYSRRYIWPEN